MDKIKRLDSILVKDDTRRLYILGRNVHWHKLESNLANLTCSLTRNHTSENLPHRNTVKSPQRYMFETEHFWKKKVCCLRIG